MDYNITLSGQSYTLSTSSDAEIAAVTACRARRNAAMPQTIDGDPVTTERTVENRTPIVDEDGNPVLDENGEPTFSITTSTVTDTTIPQVPNPALFATDEAYLQNVYANWATGNPGFTSQDLQNSWLGALASWTGQSPPEVILQEPTLTGDALKTALKAYAAAKRKQIETGGMVSQTFGHLYTDRETRAILGQIIQSIDLGIITPPVKFKAPGGFVMLDRDAFIAISAEVGQHVQAAFNVEGDVSEAIDAETITTKSEIDGFAW